MFFPGDSNDSEKIAWTGQKVYIIIAASSEKVPSNKCAILDHAVSSEPLHFIHTFYSIQ